MSDMDQVREAVELFDEHGFDWKEARNRYRHTIAAARRFLALTETGPDYEAAHALMKEAVYSGDYRPDTTRAIVDAALADYLTEEE